MLKTLCWIVFACLVLSGGVWLYEKANDGFYESAIQLHTWPKKKYNTFACAYTVEEARTALSQPFHYLGKGRQFFVFESADGKYVLKFLKCQRIDVSNIYKTMWLPKYLRVKRKVCLKFRQERVDSIFTSIALAAQSMNENTGVVYAHLNVEPTLQTNVTLFDKVGLKHEMAIDTVPFVLQKKAEEVLDVFSKLLKTKDYHEIAIRYTQLKDLILSDAKLNVVDTDSGMILRNNVGFIHNKAVHIDIGTLLYQKAPLTDAQIQTQLLYLLPLKTWLLQQDPNATI